MSMERNQHPRCRSFAAVLSVIVLAAAAWCLPPASAQNPGLTSDSKDAPPAAAEQPTPGKPAAYRVTKAQIIREMLVTGELKAARSVVINAPNVRSSFSNTISFLAPEGSIVKKGQRIVEFDDSSLQSNQSEAERTLDEAKLNIEKRKADLESQRCDLLSALSQAEAQLKQDELYGKLGKDLLAGNTYLKYQLNMTKSKLSVQKAKENLDNFEKSYASEMALKEITRSQAEISLKKIESDMQFLKIDAPQDGIVIYGDNWASNRKMQVGDSAVQGMEVASLPDLTSLQVIGNVYDTEYSLLQPEMRCTITLDALPGFKVGGRIIARTSVGSRKSFTSSKKVFQVTVQLDKVDPTILKPGMTARVIVPLVLAKDATAIPREYLGLDAQGQYFVIQGTETKSAQIRPITIGAIGNRFVEAVSGIAAGDPLLSLQRLAEVKK
jgi:HlyD family secretion protein